MVLLHNKQYKSEVKCDIIHLQMTNSHNACHKKVIKFQGKYCVKFYSGNYKVCSESTDLRPCMQFVALCAPKVNGF